MTLPPARRGNAVGADRPAQAADASGFAFSQITSAPRLRDWMKIPARRWFLLARFWSGSVRVEGEVKKNLRGGIRRYFSARPAASRIGRRDIAAESAWHRASFG